VPDICTLEAMRHTAFVTPLTSAGQVVGALAMAPRGEGQDFSEADRRLVRDLAAQAGSAAHTVRLGEALESSLEALRLSRDRLVGATEGERRRIQRDLHDGLGPVLASIQLRVEACLEAVPDSPIVPDLESLHALVGEATADIRRLVHDLYPPVLDQRGLVGALEQHCDRFGLETRLEVRLETDSYRPLATVHELGLLRIAQEALVNVAKHARASTVRVHLEQLGGDMELRVSDDGVGLGDRPPGEGAGIGSMRARAEQLGGTLRIESPPGTGTEVVVRVPTAA